MKRRALSRAICLVLAVQLCWGAAGSHAQDAGAVGTSVGEAFDEAQALAYSQDAIGRELGPHVLIGIDEAAVDLAGYRGKPLVVSMIYTSCYHVCPLITERLVAAVETANETFGADGFAVVTVGFDVGVDTPARLGAYATARGIDFPNWRLLSGDKATIDALSADLGFIYFRSPKGFDHLAQTTIVDAEGRIYRQVYGSDFAPPAIMEPLKALIFGGEAPALSLEGLVNRVRLFCTIYDPKSGRYRFDYSLFVGIFVGTLCLAGVAVVLVREWRRASRQRPS